MESRTHVNIRAPTIEHSKFTCMQVARQVLKLNKHREGQHQLEEDDAQHEVHEEAQRHQPNEPSDGGHTPSSKRVTKKRTHPKTIVNKMSTSTMSHIERSTEYDGTVGTKKQVMAPPWGLSTPRAPKKLFLNFQKVSWPQNRRFSCGFAPYLACAKLYTFPMFPACAQPPLPGP